MQFLRTIFLLMLLVLVGCKQNTKTNKPDGGREEKVNVDSLLQAATKGDANAQNVLGDCFYKGNGVKKDYKQALKWWKQASDKGFFKAYYNLSKLYYNGEGVEKNFIESFRLMKIAAEGGEKDAQFETARSYYKGEGVKKNNIEFMKWIRISAENGYPRAQCLLGALYGDRFYVEEDEFYVEKDVNKAVHWYRLSADQNNALAQNYLAECYDKGIGVVKNKKEAIKMYGLAAEQGNDLAQHTLGIKYMKGDGVVKDMKEAYFWLLLATANGNEDALADRSAVEKELNQKDKDKIREKAQKWFSEHSKEGV